MRCVTDSLAHCVQEVRRPVDVMYQRILTALGQRCPGPCDLPGGVRCIANLLESIIRTLVDPRSNCGELEREIAAARSCVRNSVTSCGSYIKDRFEEIINVAKVVSETICNLPTIPPPTLPSGIRCYRCHKAPTHETCDMMGWEYCRWNEQSCETKIKKRFWGDEISKRCRRPYYCYKKEGCKLKGKGKGGVECRFCCQGDLCNAGPGRVTPPRPTLPATEPPTCRQGNALRCILDLVKKIVDAALEGEDSEKWQQICKEDLPRVVLCVEESLKGCSRWTQESVRRALDFVRGMIGDRCSRTTPAPVCDTTMARSCIISLRAKIREGSSRQEICKAVPGTIKCVEENMKDCSPLEKEAMNRTLITVIREAAPYCKAPIVITSPMAITVTEGNRPALLTYKANYPPAQICRTPGCAVYVDLDLQLGRRPRCRRWRKAISQAVFGLQQGASQSPCSDKITEKNYMQTRQIPVAAMLDFKYDGKQVRNVSLVMRTVAGEQVKRTVVGQVQITAEDRDGRAMCKSINDPHMTTFDGHFYNHHIEGYFVLYKHANYPYEVQTIYQRCRRRGRATCNCGAAVRSGDTVFVVDRCRRNTDICLDRRCTNLMRTAVYFHNRITPGTRVFRRAGGRRFEILLPHGTLVKIQTSWRYINVWVTPSPVDLKRTRGLCGYYDGNRKNDLLMPDGTVYRGRGSHWAGQPNPFNLAWSILPEDSIFGGVRRMRFDPDLHCECKTDPDTGDVSSNCGPDSLLELCDFDTSGEITGQLQDRGEFGSYNLPAEEQQEGGHRTIREAAPYADDNIEIDPDFRPPNFTWPINGWNETAARAFCEDYIKEQSDVGQRCQELRQLNLTQFDISNDVESCVEDIQITGNTTWARSALDAMKELCMREIRQEPKIAETNEGRDAAEGIEEHSCINECSGNGDCVSGRCECSRGFTGEDCSLSTSAVPELLRMPYRGLCDVRQRDCSVSIVYGENFINSTELTCHIQPAQVTDKGVSNTSGVSNVSAIYFSFNQVTCPLPALGSYYVAVSNDGIRQGERNLMITHDAACYACDAANPKCVRKLSGNCVIKGNCYADGETDPTNRCNICRSSDYWQWNNACGLSAGGKAGVSIAVILVVAGIVAVALFVVFRSKNRSSASVTPRTARGIQLEVKSTENARKE